MCAFCSRKITPNVVQNRLSGVIELYLELRKARPRNEIPGLFANCRRCHERAWIGLDRRALSDFRPDIVPLPFGF
jgi:hypothetical protein